MKKTNKILFSTFYILFIILVFVPIISSAYTLLQPLPGFDAGTSDQGILAKYLSWLYKFALAAAAFLAVLQIVIGGVQLIIGGASESARSDGKNRIEQAIWGLLLAVCAWLILYTINPDMIKTGLTVPDIKIERKTPTTGTGAVYVPGVGTTTTVRCDVYGGILTGGHKTSFYNSMEECMRNCSSKNCTEISGGGGGGIVYVPGIGPVDTYSHKDAEDILTKNNIRIVSSGDCFDINNKSCTSLDGIPKSTITTLTQLANDFRKECPTCDMAVTGGSETGHKEHGAGLPVLDLNKSDQLSSFVKENQSKYGIKNIIDTPHGTGPHIHVVF